MDFFTAYRKPLLVFLTAALLLGSSALLLYKLGHEPFQDYDEATYAEITAESLVHGNFFSLTFLNSPYLRKPPLLFWLTDASEKLIPDKEFAMRLPSALAAILAIGVVALICFEVSGSAWVGLLGGSILAATSSFIEPARQVRFDILVSLFITAAFYAFLRAQLISLQEKSARWYLVFGVLLGLAVLSKDVITIFAGIAVLSYICFARKFEFLRNKYFWGGVGLFFVIVVPWHLYETLRYGEAFWDSYIGTEVFARVQSNIFGAGYGPTNADYVSYFFNFGAPWTELFCATLLAIPFLYRRMKPQMRAVILSSIITVFSVIAVMCISHTKAYSYLIPLYPFMAIAIALNVTELFKLRNKDFRDALQGLLIVCIPLGLYLSIYNGLHLNPYYGWATDQAREEQKVGELIKSSGPSPIVYEYNDEDLGSIQYYSQLPFTKNSFVYLLSDTSTVTSGSFVVTTVSQSELSAKFPQYTFTPAYQGAEVSLFVVSSSSPASPRT